MSTLSENPALNILAYQAIFTFIYRKKNFLQKKSS